MPKLKFCCWFVFVLQLLLSHGSDISRTNHDGESVLHYALKCGNRECVSLLLKYQPDLDARTAWGFTPLMVAAMNGRTEAALILIGAGANINATDRAQKTALHYAVKRNLASLVQTLLEHGADVDSADADGNTALVDALVASRMTLVRLLARFGCGVQRTVRTTVGNQLRWCTPLELAVAKGNLSAAKILNACGARIAEFVEPFDPADVIGSEMGEWIEQVQRNPITLSDTVRICIRDILGKNLLQNARMLPLPPALRNYISYSNDGEFL